ncbi:membrane protease subunits [Candidatus Scalindua japonica]|uniref:Membrane protease subunits n=1 Tax=Candidatus Scalindua japonica TaxID=1284222 RepID=A0A286U0Q1_9BACT|nr:SPFH domain-containing protein [Candidatus Scalindua japonica]GAX61702.1 membrane protease subunits [Candidatus Scalindua japonica]
MEKSFNPKGVKKKTPIVSKKMIFFVIVPIALVVLLVVGGRKLTWKEIQADEVAVIINNITGHIKAIDRAGAVIYYPFIQDLYILDKQEQKEPMTSSNISEDFPQGNPIILKTRDGGDVSIDLIIQYKLLSNLANKIVQDTGIGEEFKEKWIWDYARTICRYEFGELSISEFPDSVKRMEKIKTSEKELNKLLNPHGIFVTSLTFIDYRYYREYAEKIHERRLADKEVEEQVQRASAAEKNQDRVVTEETKKLDVAISRFRGTLHQMEIDARAEADKIKDAGRAYLIKAFLDADADYDRLEKEAASILAVKKAEAEGIYALKKALEGAGGRNLVKMEYARRLRKATIIGTPVLKASEEIPQLIREKQLWQSGDVRNPEVKKESTPSGNKKNTAPHGKPSEHEASSGGHGGQGKPSGHGH